MRLLVDICYLMAAVLLAPVIAYKSWRTGKYRRDWDQRRGFVPELPADKRRVWIHAVSMGEVNSVQGLIEAWRRRDPATEFVISSTTDTGIDRARKLFGDHTVIRYPLDLSWFVNRALDRIKPSIVVLVELEVWPQFIRMTARRGIPVTVVNGRITAGKSLKRFRWVMPIVRRMFAPLAWVGTQDEVYAERFRQVGVLPDRVSVTGSMKWDTAEVADSIPGDTVLAEAMGVDRARPLWVCGSTAPGEEAVILEVYQRLLTRCADLQLAIIPRKPERFDEVAELIARREFACLRRSESPDGTVSPPANTSTVRLGDTMGELRKFYALADVVFVGRTLADMGGSDMMEVAALARPMILGPHTHNFADTMKQLNDADAVRIVAEDLTCAAVTDALHEAVSELLNDRTAAAAMGRRGREVVERNRGATESILDRLMGITDRAKHRTA